MPEISRLIEASKKVILDCSLENGAIVAANSTKPYYPKEAKNYFYVWPRDASFACVAADMLGLPQVPEKFFGWLMERAEGWKGTGLFYEKYHPNGMQATNRFQPDQGGSVLFALWHHFKDNPENAGRYGRLAAGSADGICKAWKKGRFSQVTNDLWEERLAFPDLEENFTYSLAACIHGLKCADSLLETKKYARTAREMKRILLANARKKGHFFRSFGRLNDERIDASLLGLLWPFGIVEADNQLFKRTLELIEGRIVKNYGVYRYEQDEYDGWMFRTMHRKKGGGFWPILNFWMSVVLERMGNKKKARAYYTKAINAAGNHLPEQIFENNIQKSVSPLCWSHAMFIIASKELDLMRTGRRASPEQSGRQPSR